MPLFVPNENKIEHNSMAMCADCVDSAINLGREILGMSGLNTSFPSSVISLEELSSVIIPREHSKHAFKNDLIDEMCHQLSIDVLDSLSVIDFYLISHE